MDDVMVQPAGQPADNRVFGRVIGRGREDVIHAILELAAVGGEVCAVNGMGGLEYERDAQTDDQMNQKKRARDQHGRFSQHEHRQHKHVGEVEAFARKENRVFAQGVPCALQVIVSREEKALEVAEQHIVERK